MRGITQDNRSEHSPEESLAVVHRLPTDPPANPIRTGWVDRRARKRNDRIQGNVRIGDALVGWEARVAEQNSSDGTAVFASTAGPFSWKLTRERASHGIQFILEPDIGQPDGSPEDVADNSMPPPSDSATVLELDDAATAPRISGPRLMLVPELPRTRPEYPPPAQMPLPLPGTQVGPGPGQRSRRQSEGAPQTPAGTPPLRPAPRSLPPLPPVAWARDTRHSQGSGSTLSTAQLGLFGLLTTDRRASTKRRQALQSQRGRVLIHADRLTDAVQCLAVFMDVSNRLVTH